MADAARVALVAPVPPLRGGIAHHSEALVHAFLRLGCDVRVVSYRRQYPRALFPGTSEVDADARPPPVKVTRVLSSAEPASWVAGARALRAYNPDLVVTAWWNAAVTAPVVCALAEARVRGVAAVVLAHNAQSHDARALDRVSWAALARVATAVVTHARADAETLARLYPFLPVVAHPHPAYARFLPPAGLSRAAARAQLAVPESARVCLLLGHVRPYKGADVAVRAFARLAAEDEHAHLVLAGEVYDSARASVESALGELAPAARLRVRMLDRYVPDEELARWLHAADVLWAPHRRASHSGGVLAARAVGLPVVASRTGGLPEAVGDDDELVPPEDPFALAAAAARALARGRRAPLSRDEIERAWEALARAILDAGAVSSSRKEPA